VPDVTQESSLIPNRLPTLNSQWGIRTLLAGEALLILLAIALGRDTNRIADYATILISLTTLFALAIFHREILDIQSRLHREVMGEQTTMRRLQTRPHELVYFARKRNPETDREMLMLDHEHFGGGPALDVQFAFTPPLVNSEGKTFAKELPFLTGIPVMAPGFRREIEFDDYYRFHAQAGATRIGTMLGVPIEETRLDFEATVTLRDPIGDDQPYTIQYTLDPRDLLPSTLVFRPSEEGAIWQPPRS
jgi:hypothetical protein